MNRSRPPRSARAGVAALEFALFLPVAALAMLATADLVSYMRVRLVVDETAMELASDVTQYRALYDSDIPALFAAAQTLAGATPVTGALGATIVSCVFNAGSGPAIAWREQTGNPGFASRIGAVGGAPTLPDGYAVPVNQSLIVTEIYTTATAWVLAAGFMGSAGSGALYGYSMQQPRLALLSRVAPGNRPPAGP